MDSWKKVIIGIVFQVRSSSKIFPVSVPLRGSVRMNASRPGSLLVGRCVGIGRNSATGTPRDSIIYVWPCATFLSRAMQIADPGSFHMSHCDR